MDAYSSADEYIKSFIDEIEAIGANTTATPAPPPPSAAASSKKRKRVEAVESETKKPGWVPKPATDCPIVSWVDRGNVFAVQNPANIGRSLLKMQLYDGSEMVYMCGLFLDNNSDAYASVGELIDKLENLWIDKSTGVPKTNGLTQTVTPSLKDSTTSAKQKKRPSVARKNRPNPRSV